MVTIVQCHCVKIVHLHVLSSRWDTISESKEIKSNSHLDSEIIDKFKSGFELCHHDSFKMFPAEFSIAPGPTSVIDNAPRNGLAL